MNEETQSQGIPIANFSPDIQGDLYLLCTNKDGLITTKQLEVAMQCMTNYEQGRIAITSMDPKLQSKIEVLEPDQEGYVSFGKIEEALMALIDQKQRSRYSTFFWTALTVAGIILLASVFGLLYLVVDLHKDMQSMNGVLTDRATGLPMQTASTDLTVKNGVVVSKPQPGASRRAILSTPISTAPFWTPINISSEMAASEFTAIPSLTLRRAGSAGLVFLQVRGFAAIPARNAPGSKVVVFSTDLGAFVLNGTALYPAIGPYAAHGDTSLASVMTRAFTPLTVQGTGRSLQGDPVKYDPITGMDAYGNCVICTICSCL
eukprot:CAMPEP_0172154202 /NCGR_PEP_ID=MMETSP1050-20130122/1899_1 /TAXON_ID=233186 /ORGANISM="Cryptomonas curvata, Strain CCAP979/52" /LENGTH=317 /DNA_ID=CAMNT_0012822883 /DNA_START=27 /DNA_END=980 /DNA_ORIENTATION=+